MLWHRYYRRFLIMAVLMALMVIGVGAYTRLTDAGLGCPDWPGCYGKLFVPEKAAAVKQAMAHFPDQPIERQKAWHEMAHRYVAGSLGVVVVLIIVGGCYFTWPRKRPVGLFILLSCMLIMQILLGMWTVTWQLMPVVVMGHLLGGFTILALLTWLCLLAHDKPGTEKKQLASPSDHTTSHAKKRIQHLFYQSMGALFFVGVQVMLGGWMSANHAALACVDFPTCRGSFFPHMTWSAFCPVIGWFTHCQGVPLDPLSKVTMHMVHRYGAIWVTLYLLVLLMSLLRSPWLHLRLRAIVLFVVLVVQLVLGICNVLLSLPFFTAVSHNLMAAVLCMVLIGLCYRCDRIRKEITCHDA